MCCELVAYRSRVGVYYSTAASHNCKTQLKGYCCAVSFLILICSSTSSLLPVALFLFLFSRCHHCVCMHCYFHVKISKVNSESVSLPSSANIDNSKDKNNHLTDIDKFHRLNNYSFDNTNRLLMCSGDIESNPGPVDKSQDLCVIHINVQSLKHKIDLIEAESSAFDIITISESWLSQNDNNNSIRLTNFHQPIRRDRPNDPHGGVAIYVRNNLYCKARPDLEIQDLEAVWVETKQNQESILIGSFYRPPNSVVQYWTLIRDSLTKVNNTGLKFIVLGDFNSNWIATPSPHLLNLINIFQLTQCITEPTRVTDTSSTCIDLIMLQSQHLITKSEVLPEICSDHRVPCVYIRNRKPQGNTFKRTIYNYKKLDHKKFNDLLSKVNWVSVLLDENINHSALNFSNILMDTGKSCTPTKRIKVCKKDALWITDEIKLLISEKRKAHKLAKLHNNTIYWANFRRIRNDLTKKIRERKAEYLNELDNRISDCSNFNSKEWWKLVKTFMSKKGIETDEIPPLEFNGTVYYSNKDKAEILNTFFSLQSTIPHDNDPIPNITITDGPVLTNIEITENDVSTAIGNLDINKAVGPDLIHNCLLKAAQAHITKPLTRFFNRCLNEGIFPESWKTAHVTPLHKKGAKEICSNYRPISLLSCVGKLLESCIHKYVFKFLSENNIITQAQSGFIPGDSTTNQLLCIYDDLCSSFDRGLTTQAVYLDITKAFDRVWHKGLLAKLNACGIQGPLLKWFQNYLKDRKQAVVIKGEKSQFKTISAGVPQGSVLGPLLFVVYINDIVRDLHSTIKLFADDTSLSLSLENPYIRANTLNEDLKTVANWAKDWKVEFNERKTEVVNFIQGPDDCEEILLNNVHLENFNKHKHLGLTLQCNFKWDTHIGLISSKINMLLSCLTSYKYRLGRKSLVTLYKAYIMPHFDYADVIWDSCSDTLSIALENLHLQALRTITGLVRGTSHQTLYDESGFCTLKERRKRHKLLTYKKIILGLCPNSLSALIPPLVSDANPYPRRKPYERVIPPFRTETYHKSFFPSTTELWNKLPVSMQTTTSISEFKRFLSSSDPIIPHHYYAGERMEQIIHCRLRSCMSNLNEDLYNRHIQPNRSCSCGYRSENARHYLLFCDHFLEARRNTIYTLPRDWIDTQTLLYGNPKLCLTDNIAIVLIVHEFIRQSKRFN